MDNNYTQTNNAIEMKNIVMEFGGVCVLDHVNFNLKKGEIRGLAGKNGAGKSTLMKIINGVYTQTSGTVRYDGKEINRHISVKEREKYVSMIYQDFSLVGQMSVMQNIFLNAEPLKKGLIDDAECEQQCKNFFESLEISIDPKAKISSLSTGDMQMVEIAKAIMKQTKIILMDEPTAALDSEATKNFFKIIRKLKEQGYSILISTHHLQHLMDICDSITVITDGKISLDTEVGDATLESVISAMLGENIKIVEKRRENREFDKAHPLMSVRNVTSKEITSPLSFDLYKGEVLGLAGLKGAGRTEIVDCIFGIDPIRSGEIQIRGKIARIRNTSDAIRSGVFLIPENRHTQGLSLMHTLYDNALLPIVEWLAKGKLLIDDRKGGKIVQHIIDSMQVKTPSQNTPINKLSGGNQQKVVIGKALESHPSILLMDDPTYGVDIRAKEDIKQAIREYTSQGNGVVFISSELGEMLENCDRILLIKFRKIAGEIEGISKGILAEEDLMSAIQ